MNSALQCMANTKFFNDYFIKDKKYLTQMNLKNKSGHSGDLAQNFALLVNRFRFKLILDAKNVDLRLSCYSKII
jgi:ubiquitin C-terminal hydrolase